MTTTAPVLEFPTPSGVILRAWTETPNVLRGRADGPVEAMRAALWEVDIDADDERAAWFVGIARERRSQGRPQVPLRRGITVEITDYRVTIRNRRSRQTIEVTF